MNQMRAAQYDAYGPAEGVTVRTVDIPALEPGTALIRVAASAVEAADILIRSGKAKVVTGSEFPRGVGFDFTGQIAEVAADVTAFRPGDEVWGFIPSNKLLPSGAVAEFVRIPVSQLALRPASLTAVEAAALPGVGGAVLKMFDEVRLRAGDRILIRGAAGGMGLTAVQIAHHLGAHVTGLVSAKDLDRVRLFGADETVDYRTVDLASLGRFDVIFDTVGTGMGAFRRRLSPTGRMITTTPGGPAGLLYIKLSAVFRARRVRFIQAPRDAAALRRLTDVVDADGIHPVVDQVFTLDDVAAAHRAEEARGGFGRRVVQVAA